MCARSFLLLCLLQLGAVLLSLSVCLTQCTLSFGHHGDPPSSAVGVAQVRGGQAEGLFWQTEHASLGLLVRGSLKLQERTFQKTPLTRRSCDTLSGQQILNILN